MTLGGERLEAAQRAQDERRQVDPLARQRRVDFGRFARQEQDTFEHGVEMLDLLEVLLEQCPVLGR